jgi:hypothetical protein
MVTYDNIEKAFNNSVPITLLKYMQVLDKKEKDSLSLSFISRERLFVK